MPIDAAIKTWTWSRPQSNCEDRNPVYEGEWRHGTAGLYHPEADRFRIWVEVAVEEPLAVNQRVLGLTRGEKPPGAEKISEEKALDPAR